MKDATICFDGDSDWVQSYIIKGCALIANKKYREAKKLFARGSEKFPRSIELAITRETGLNIIKAEAPATICEYVSLLIYSHNKANIIEVVDTHMQESKARLKRLARYNKENKIRLKKKMKCMVGYHRYLVMTIIKICTNTI